MKNGARNQDMILETIDVKGKLQPGKILSKCEVKYQQIPHFVQKRMLITLNELGKPLKAVRTMERIAKK